MSSRPKFLAVSFVLLVLLGVGCGNQESEPEVLETEDIGPGLEIEISEDQQAAPRAPEFAGVLPEDFPADMPLYVPSSLVDFGRKDGGRYLSILSPHRPAKIRQALPALLRGGGWQIEGDLGRGEKATLRKGRQQVQLQIENGRPGTLLRYTY